ncbi:3972_t:CDS:2 [Ambispora gerdemannii]|uniref:3972_t:CDS:1 n=1 Tax=Ambispora gerdemannii TaxID=144530 RepID=A0A9N9H718_9GLOM|nr:3972_t:CDS:2 [Ambispora gerdemannii]
MVGLGGLEPPTSPLSGVLNTYQPKLVKITGILTSRIEKKPSSDIPAYGFFKLEGGECAEPEDKAIPIDQEFLPREQHDFRDLKLAEEKKTKKDNSGVLEIVKDEKGVE